MSRRGTKPDLGKAILMSLTFSGHMTARAVWREVQVHLWDAEISMSSVVARLEFYVEQGLVEKSTNVNGATRYKLKVDIEFA